MLNLLVVKRIFAKRYKKIGYFMPWRSNWPVGTISVKANRAFGNDNTIYIQTTMGNSVVGTNTNTTRDHFWAVGSDEDGRHRFMQSPGFVDSGGDPSDPVLGVGMDGVLYLKKVLDNFEWFRRNANGIYQVSPVVKTGVVKIPSSYVNVVAVPANCYGEIFMYTTNTSASDAAYQTVTGFFRSDGAFTNAWAIANKPQGSATVGNGLKFGNGNDASGLNIRARAADAPDDADWNYIVTYRAL
jgi:hypothetical protein